MWMHAEEALYTVSGEASGFLVSCLYPIGFLEGARGNRFGERHPLFAEKQADFLSPYISQSAFLRERGETALVSATLCSRRNKRISCRPIFPNRLS